jgi:hypothetical protein
MADESRASGVSGGHGDGELPSFHEALEESSDEEPDLQGEEDGDAQQAGGIETVMWHVLGVLALARVALDAK